MRYIIRPKKHLVGKALKKFYLVFLGPYSLPREWMLRPELVIEFRGDERIVWIRYIRRAT